MTKRRSLSRGPQALAAQAQYLWNQRRVKLWIPFLENKIVELQARVQEKSERAEKTHSGEHS